MGRVDLAGLVREGRLEDAFRLARFFYRIGEPLVTDRVYEMMVSCMESAAPDSPLLQQTYDDDESPVGLLAEFGLMESLPTCASAAEYEQLNEDKSFSIEAVTDYGAAYRWYQGVKDFRLILMLKMDGVYTKSLNIGGETRVCLSRGRSGNSFDLTDTSVRYVIPRFVDFGTEGSVRLYGEAFVPTQYLDELQEMFQTRDKFTTTKGGAITLLRKRHRADAYRFVKQVMFDADGLADSKSETLKVLKEKGFEVVPYVVIEPGTLGDTAEEFKCRLKRLMDEMYEKAAETYDFVIPTDGLVLEVDEKNVDFAVSGQYSARNIALKFEYWSYEYYKGVIEDIVLTPRRVKYSVRVKIKKMYTSDRCAAVWINGFNLAILAKHGLCVGSTIYFSRASNAYNNLIYGENLQKILVGEDDKDD